MTAVKYMSHSHRFRKYSHPQAERKVGRVHKHEFSNNSWHNIMRQLRENILHLPTQTHVHIFWVPSLAHAFVRSLHIHPITFWQFTQVKTHRKHTFSILNYETISRKKVKTHTKCYTNAHVKPALIVGNITCLCWRLVDATRSFITSQSRMKRFACCISLWGMSRLCIK